MRLIAFFVKHIPHGFVRFSSILLKACFQSVTRRFRWIPWRIKRGGLNLFWHTEGEMRRLAIRPGGIGDFVLSLPALECLSTEYFEVWTQGRNAPLVRFAGRVRSVAATGLDLLGVTEPPVALIDELRGFDSIVSWYGANRPEFREATEALGLSFTFFPALPASGGSVHAADFYLEQARTVADRASDGIPRIPCESPRGDYAVIHPFSGSRSKDWPLENYRALAGRLERLMPVRWCSGPEDPQI